MPSEPTKAPSAATCPDCGNPTDECCVGEGCKPALVSLAEDAYLLLDAWLHTGNLPEREYAYSVRDALGVELTKQGSAHVR